MQWSVPLGYFFLLSPSFWVTVYLSVINLCRRGLLYQDFLAEWVWDTLYPNIDPGLNLTGSRLSQDTDQYFRQTIY
jgi:hypothetical protein